MDAIDLTRQLVRIPSVNPGYGITPPEFCGETRMAEFLHGTLSRNGFTVQRHEPKPGRPYLVAEKPGRGRGAGAPAVIFCAHLDTVPVCDMTIDPFDPKNDPFLIHGRGSCDDKASIAASAAACADAGDHVPPVVLVYTCDEEFGFTGAEHFMSLPGRAWAGCVVCEPTAGVAILGHKGVYRCVIGAAGRSAHSSTPERGDNAIYRMARIISRLETLAGDIAGRVPHPQLGSGTLCVSIVRGGTAVNSVPSCCEIQIDRRTVPGETAAGAEAELRAALADETGWTVSAPTLDASCICLDARHPFAQTAVAALGLPVGYVSYATDGSAFAPQGIPTIVYGPGNIAQAHTADEYIAVADIRDAVERYRALLRALCG